MADALYAGLDLGALAGCFFLIALLAVVAYTFSRLASVFRIIPFVGGTIAGKIEGVIVAGCNDGIRSLENAAASFESGLIDSFGMLIAIPALLYLGVRAALEYFWHSALRPTIHSITDPIRAVATEALSTAKAAVQDAARAYTRAVDYADAVGSRTLNAAKSYAEAQAAAVLARAEGYADVAVGQLRAAEDTAIANALRIANSAIEAAHQAEVQAVREAEAFTSTAVAGVERAADSAIAQAEAAAARALAEAQAAGQAALDGVKGIAVGAEHEIEDLVGSLGVTGAAGLIAAIPAIATLVHAIAVESGLENAECRTKVKGICGTNPSSWGSLIAGLAAVGAGFSLETLYTEALGVMPVARGLVTELTKGGLAEAPKLGQIIGDAANALVGA